MELKENKMGKWLLGNMPTYGGYKCSKCGYQTVEYKLEKCPSCKTTMYTKYVGYKRPILCERGIIMEEYRDCLACSNSFSEPSEDGEDKLYCVLFNKYVEEDDVCEEFN